jgi:UDP-N-acetylmuramate--alanine ligase
VTETKIKYKHIRFLGAEGIGMTALIKILEEQKKLGIQVPNLKISKSDLAYKKNDPLEQDIDLVVRSTAINSADPEYQELVKRKVEIWHRSDMLNYLSAPYKQIVVSGTHGKTTCSAMLAHILVECGLDPCFAVGGILTNYATNGRAGAGEFFVLEGDESDKSFTKTNPYLALVTCIEPDHLENYPGGLEEIKNCFYKFLDSAEICVINIDDPLLKAYQQANLNRANLITYSSQELSNYEINLKIPGLYNKLNALACLKAAQALGAKTEDALKALKSFSGIKRRFELINDNYLGSIKVYDDYAHHPTELKAFLDGALSLNPKKMVFVYQPHHPERTQQFWGDFVKVLKEFPPEHLCLLAEVYVARSKHIPGITCKRMVEEINLPNVRFLPAETQETTSQGNLSDMAKAYKQQIDKELSGADYLFIVGAGNISKVADAYRAFSANP